MPLATVPAVDANICSGWNEQQLALYNKLDFYLAKRQVDRAKWWKTWGRFLGSVKWKANMGDTMRTVITEPSPHLRQFAHPTQITSGPPRKDVIDIRERRVDEQVYRHRFESLQLSFIPDFRDFMSHVNDNSKDIMDKQERFEDIYYRSRILFHSPFVWLPDAVTGIDGGELHAAPTELGNIAMNAANSKNTAWFQAQVPNLGAPGNLSMSTLNKLLTVAENDIGNLPFTGSDQGKENVGMQNKYALVCSTEAFNRFSVDPFLLAHKNCDLDIINGRFQGSLFGRITAIMEKHPLRFKADGTFVAPETRELNPNAYNYGETIPNPVYTSPLQSPYEVAFLVGAEGYDRLEVGPPPSAFTGDAEPDGFASMFWNGEIRLTKNFLVPCVDADGVVTMVTNNYGEHLMFISQVAYGMRKYQPRNIIPILFKRVRGINPPA